MTTLTEHMDVAFKFALKHDLSVQLTDQLLSDVEDICTDGGTPTIALYRAYVPTFLWQRPELTVGQMDPVDLQRATHLTTATKAWLCTPGIKHLRL